MTLHIISLLIGLVVGLMIGIPTGAVVASIVQAKQSRKDAAEQRRITAANTEALTNVYEVLANLKELPGAVNQLSLVIREYLPRAARQNDRPQQQRNLDALEETRRE